MNNVLRQIEIDVYSPTSYEIIKAQQGDRNSRIIEFILYNQGNPYEVSDNVFFKFAGHRGDGSSFMKTEEECITRNGNRIKVTLLEDILYYAGIIEAKLVMYELSEKTELFEKSETTVLSTIPFKISCIKNPCNENNLSKGEFSIVTDLVSQMKEFSIDAEKIITNAASSAEKAQKSELNAKNSEVTAREYYDLSKDNSYAAENFSNMAKEKSIESGDYATLAESFARGGTNTRPNENEDNAMKYAKAAQSYAVGDTDYRSNEKNDCAKYYYEMTKNIRDNIPTAEYVSEHFVPDYIQKGYFVTQEKGWYRIAEYDFPSVGGYDTDVGITCVVDIKRIYANNTPEYHKIQLLQADGGAKFVNVTDYGNILITKIRVVWDNVSKKFYLEIFHNGTQGNNAIASISGGYAFYDRKWKFIDEQIVPEISNGIIILATGDLSKQFDISDLLNKNNGGTINKTITPAGGITYAGKTGYIAYPNDGYLMSRNQYHTGCLKITMPTSWETDAMIKFVVSIYNYVNNESTDYYISGYTYSYAQSWLACTAVCVGKSGTIHSNLQVQFGHDGDKCAISIGKIDTMWNHPNVQVHDIQIGLKDNSFSTWRSGWRAEIVTNELDTIQTTISNTHVAYGCHADTANKDGQGNVIANTYLKRNWTLIGKPTSKGGQIAYNSTASSNINYREFLVAAGLFNDSERMIKAIQIIPKEALDELYNFWMDTATYMINVDIDSNVLIESWRGGYTFINSTYSYDVWIYGR